MADRDFYKILGVQSNADEREIRKAYRELARKYHPDRNPDNPAAEDRFKDASYASDVLLDMKKRELYDEFGENGLKEGFDAGAYRRYSSARSGAGGFGGGPSIQDLFSGRVQGGGSVQDLFGSEVMDAIFGRESRARGRHRSQRPGQDIVSDIAIEFADAIKGVEKELTIKTPGQPDRFIKVRLPAGVKDGGKIRLRGQGHEGGDLLLKVRVLDHPHFRRDGDDLLLDLPVTIAEALHGTSVSIPTVGGDVKLRIPKRMKGGGKLRLRGKGVKRGKKLGDLIVQVHIQLPGDPTALEETVEKLDDDEGSQLRDALKL